MGMPRAGRIQVWSAYFIVVLCTTGFMGCRTRKVTVTLPPVAPTDSLSALPASGTEVETRIRFDYKSPKVLARKVDEQSFDYTWMNSRFTAETQVEGRNNSFQVNVRARRDSALWMSFSLLGIEGARMLVTRDSVKFIDRVNRKYFVGDYSFLSQQLNTDLDFEMLESVLVGNSVEFFDDDDKLKSFRENGEYILSTVRKRKLRRTLRKIEAGDTARQDLIQRIFLDPITFRITKNLIQDPPSGRTFDAFYSSFQKVDSLLFPFDQRFEVQANKKLSIHIVYSKVETGKVQQFPFSIPSRYDAIR